MILVGTENTTIDENCGDLYGNTARPPRENSGEVTWILVGTEKTMQPLTKIVAIYTVMLCVPYWSLIVVNEVLVDNKYFLVVKPLETVFVP